MMTDQEKAFKMLRALGMWTNVAQDLSQEYSLDRIAKVVDYVVNQLEYEAPASAVLKGLRDDWDIPEFDMTIVQEILADAQGESFDGQ